jgi:hypothetical protein
MEYTSDGGVEWRARIKLDLEDIDICWLDPCKKPTKDFVEDPETHRRLREAKQCGDYSAIARMMKPIRNFDLRCSDMADFLIVHLDQRIPTFGTIEELSNANRQKKPILVHVEQGKRAASSWLFAMIPHEMIFSSWETLVAYVRHIAYDPEIDRLNRWCFFDLQA